MTREIRREGSSIDIRLNGGRCYYVCSKARLTFNTHPRVCVLQTKLNTNIGCQERDTVREQYLDKKVQLDKNKSCVFAGTMSGDAKPGTAAIVAPNGYKSPDSNVIYARVNNTE